MSKKLALVGIVLIILVASIFISMRRSRMMSSIDQVDAGGLKAVTANGTPMPVPAQAAELPENMAIQESNGLLVSLAMNPYPPTGTKSTDFDVTLADASGQAISDASISLDLTMPSMWMPPNQPVMESVGGGKYHTAGRFTMRGLWRIEVIITRGSQKQSVFFDVGL